MPQLRVLPGVDPEQVVPLENHEMTIGRAPSCDLVLNQESLASRHHATIYSAAGQWRIRDLGSLNGTLLNGRRIEDSALAFGDEIAIDKTSFIFEEAVSHQMPVSSESGTASSPEDEKVQELVRAMSA